MPINEEIRDDFSNKKQWIHIFTILYGKIREAGPNL